MNKILAADMPNMKKEDRKSVYSQLKSVFPRSENTDDPMSLEELGAIIARGVK